MGSSASQHVHYPTTESSSTPPTPLLNPPQSILLVSPRQFTTFLAPLTEQFPNIIHITTDRSNTATPPSIAELQALLPNPLPPGPITLLVCSTSNTLPSLLITALLTASPPLPLSSLYLLPIPPLSTPTHLAHSYNIHTLSDAIFLLANPTVTRADVCALTVPAGEESEQEKKTKQKQKQKQKRGNLPPTALSLCRGVWLPLFTHV